MSQQGVPNLTPAGPFLQILLILGLCGHLGSIADLTRPRKLEHERAELFFGGREKELDS